MNVNLSEDGNKINIDEEGKRKEYLLNISSQKMNFDSCNSQSTVQLLLIKVIQEVIDTYADILTKKHLDFFCNILDKSYDFALQFNS